MTHAFIAFLAAAEVLVGVLENPQCKPKPTRAVRVMFARTGTGWTPLTGESENAAAPFPTSWTVALDGRSVGTISTTDPGWKGQHTWSYPRDRLLDLVGSAPAAPNRKKRFDGWCEAPADRPLVVVSRPFFTDPAGWKRVGPSDDLRERVFPQFKARAGRQVNCPKDPETSVEFEYSARHLVLLAGYADKQGRRLVAVSLNPKLNGCDGPTEPAWWPNWYLLPADGGQPVFLGEGLELVDAGDYDHDGRSEVIFWYSGYNLDGYVLFADEFASRVEYLWGYH